MKAFLVGIASLIGVILIAILLMGIATVRWHLITITTHPAAFYLWTSILMIVLGVLVSLGEPKFGSMLIIPGTILLIIGLCKVWAPHTSTAAEKAKEVTDQRAAYVIQDAIAPKQISPCDRTMDPRKTPFFDHTTGKARIWVERDPKTGRWKCFDSQGHNPVTSQLYEEATFEIAMVVLQQEPEDKPIAAPTPTPISAPPAQVAAAVAISEPTPLPQLGEPIPEGQ